LLILTTEDGEDMFFKDDWDPDRLMDGSYGGGMMTNGGVGMMMIFLGLLLVMLAGTAIFWAIKASSTPTLAPSTGVGRAGSSRDVLDLRLARGEINAEEYAATRALLGP
jgi:uncharacterized membrane protein